jgi:transcriptional regulator with XRE-family HTH domain
MLVVENTTILVEDVLMPNRLKEIRTKRKLSQQQLADLVGTSNPQIGRLENGQRKLTREWAERLASSLNCTAAEIMLTQKELADLGGALVSPLSGIRVYYWGEIKAGAPSNIMDAPPEPDKWVEDQEDSRFPGVERFALRVIGDSMDLIAPSGSTVICVKIIDIGRQPTSGEIVVVLNRAPEGFLEATLKEYVEKAGEGYLWPRSSNPDFQQPLKFGDQGEEDQTTIHALAIRVLRDL